MHVGSKFRFVVTKRRNNGLTEPARELLFQWQLIILASFVIKLRETTQVDEILYPISLVPLWTAIFLRERDSDDTVVVLIQPNDLSRDTREGEARVYLQILTRKTSNPATPAAPSGGNKLCHRLIKINLRPE